MTDNRRPSRTPAEGAAARTLRVAYSALTLAVTAVVLACSPLPGIVRWLAIAAAAALTLGCTAWVVIATKSPSRPSERMPHHYDRRQP